MEAKDNRYTKYEPFFGSWYIKEKIGHGSFGNVYEIYKRNDEKYRAALKIISIPNDEDDIRQRLASGTTEEAISDYYESVLEELRRENDIMSQLKGNTNIVSYEDHDIIPHDNGLGYDILIKMELLTPLVKYIGDGRLSERGVVKLGIDVARALELCHSKNIIHRDIKPANIFVSGNGDFKLGDFGIARIMEKADANMSRKGTLNFMAPEIYIGTPYNETVDLYSLGLVMYTLLNGRGPFLPESYTYNDEDAARNMRFGGTPLPLPENADPELGAIITKACAFASEDRFRSATEMRKALESFFHSKWVETSYNSTSERKTAAVDMSPVYGQQDRTGTGRLPFTRPVTQEKPDILAAAADLLGDRRILLVIGAVVLVLVVLLSALALQGGNKTNTAETVPEETVESADAGTSEQPEEQQSTSSAGNESSQAGTGTAGGATDEAVATPMTDQDLTSEITITDYDINYSQVDNYDTAPIDVLLRIENKNTVPIRKITYRIKQQSKYVKNRVTGGDTFEAYGYIKPGEMGYFYGQITIPDTSSSKQGKIRVVSTEAAPDLGGYVQPEGYIVGYLEEPEKYDVEIQNPNSTTVKADTALVIAVREDVRSLADTWGCGVLKQDIPAGADVVLKDAIVEPGISEFEMDAYRVFIIDKKIIGLN